MLISAGPAKDLRKKPSWTETLGASVAHPVRAMQAGCSRVRPSALCDAVFSKPWAWCHHYKRGPNVCFDSSLDYMVSVGSMRIPDLALSLKQLKIKPFYLKGFTNSYLLTWCPEMGGLEAQSSIMAKAPVFCLSGSCPPGSVPWGRRRAGRAEACQNQPSGVSDIPVCSHRWHLVLEVLLVAKELSFKILFTFN